GHGGALRPGGRGRRRRRARRLHLPLRGGLHPRGQGRHGRRGHRGAPVSAGDVRDDGFPVVTLGGTQDPDDPSTWELDPAIAARLKRNDAGLVRATVQEPGSGRVRMMAWMDDHALAYVIGTRRGTYWSRSRSEYWIKGLTSGHFQHV